MDNGRELLKAFNQTAQSARKSWLLLITLMAYLIVAVASVTHIDLLLNAPLKLPILQIETGLRGFFIVAPALFILVHFGVLLHHGMLTRKAVALDSALRTEERTTDAIHPFRAEISSYFFAQDMVGPERRTVLHFLLRSMNALTLELLPLCLVLSFQVVFLPAHDAAITALHRFYVISDICILILLGGGRFLPKKYGFWRGLVDIAGAYPRNARAEFGAVLLVLFLSICVATLPSQKEQNSFALFDLDRLLTALLPAKVPFDLKDQVCHEWRGDRCAFWPTAATFEQPIDYVSGRAGIFSRNLVVTDNQTLVPKRQLSDGESSFSLRGRDLRYATFDRSDLRQVDFTAANLSGASFRGADLRGAKFECATTGGGGQNCTDLTKGDLTEAKLTDKAINRARLVEVVLSRTDIRGFDFEGVALPKADFSGAELRGVNFSSAYLAGANLSRAAAEGALFPHANMQASDLTDARLDGVDLKDADLSGAIMGGASLFAADLSGALLFGAFLHGASVWQTVPSEKKAYTLADLTDLQIKRPSPDDIKRLENVFGSIRKNAPHRNYIWSNWPSLIRPDVWEIWNKSDAKIVWQYLSNNTQQSASRGLGRYLGELACVNEYIFRGILEAHSDIYRSSNGYGWSFELPLRVLPPGVTEDDLGKTPDSGIYDISQKISAPQFRDVPDLATAFYERIKDPNCKATKDISATTIENLRIEIEETKRRAKREAQTLPGTASNPATSTERR